MRVLIKRSLGSNLIENFCPRVATFSSLTISPREGEVVLDGLKVEEGSVADGDLVNRCFDEFGPEIVIIRPQPTKIPMIGKNSATNAMGSIHWPRQPKGSVYAK